MTHERDDPADAPWGSVMIFPGGVTDGLVLDAAPAFLLIDACDGSLTHVGSRLRSLLTAHKLWLALSDELAAASEPAVPSLSSELLAGAEDFTGIPAITSVLVLDGPEPGPQPHPADASHWIRLLRRALTALGAYTSRVRVAVDVAVGLRHYQYVGSVPPHESSPCGVVRLRTPLVPRAPGSFSVSAGPQGPFLSAA